jgi:undecaprenyl-phosphate galactose phosphotransferase
MGNEYLTYIKIPIFFLFKIDYNIIVLKIGVYVRSRELLNFIILILLDIIILIFIFYISTIFRDSLQVANIPKYIEVSLSDFIFAILIIIILFISEKIYSFRFDFWQETKKILKALFISYLLVLTILALTKNNFHYSRLFIGIFFILSAILIPISKIFVKKYLYRLKLFIQKVLVIGENSNKVERFKRELTLNKYLGQIPSNNSYSSVFIISDGIDSSNLSKLIQKYLNKNIRGVYIVPYISTINFANSTILEYSNIRNNSIHIENRLLKWESRFFKNLFDKLLALLLLPIFTIAHIILSIIIKLDSRGSVLFKQKRVGQDGKEFLCLKYRTMFENSDEILKSYLDKNPQEIEYYQKYHKYKNDPRVTKLGRILRSTSLDELPQIINVLKGDMSFVGPRPYMVDEIEKLGEFRDIILKVKPGITGLWQVSGRNNLTFQQRIELESWYIKNWTLWDDFIIIIKTFSVVFKRVGAK